MTGDCSLGCTHARREFDTVLMSPSVSQIGISIAAVTLSLISMNRCNVSWRSLLLVDRCRVGRALDWATRRQIVSYRWVWI